MKVLPQFWLCVQWRGQAGEGLEGDFSGRQEEYSSSETTLLSANDESQMALTPLESKGAELIVPSR